MAPSPWLITWLGPKCQARGKRGSSCQFNFSPSNGISSLRADTGLHEKDWSSSNRISGDGDLCDFYSIHYRNGSDLKNVATRSTFLSFFKSPRISLPPAIHMHAFSSAHTIQFFRKNHAHFIGPPHSKFSPYQGPAFGFFHFEQS